MAKWTILPYVFSCVSITKINYNDIMEMSVVQLFYLTAYNLEMEGLKKQQVETWKLNN